MQACSAKGCYFGNVLKLSLNTRTHTLTLPILKTFTYNIQHSIQLPNRCPQRKTALKNSHRWCSNPQTSVTSQTAPHCSPHLTQPTPEVCLTHLVLGVIPFPKGLLLCVIYFLCLQIHNSFTISQSTPAPHTACLNLGTFVPTGPIIPIVPLLPAIAPATSLVSDWQFS